MKQITYHFYNQNELKQIIPSISNDEDYKSASGILMQLYNPRIDIDEPLMLSTITNAFPTACISGITSANIASEDFDLSDHPVELSVTFFKHTTLVQYDFNMESTSSFVAGRVMNEALESLENLKCLQIFYTSNSTSINVFTKEFSHHKLPIFGIKAGRNIRLRNNAHVYGRQVYPNGFVVIAFVSTKLKLYMDNNLGWQPIGVEMVITKTSGGSIISEIDKKPAIDIYQKYLKVQPNKYFFENVAEFPLIMENGGVKIARVPAAYDENGSIILTSDIETGRHVRLSFATPEQLITLTKQSADDLTDFKPEAVYLFECGNRLRYLKNDYTYEINQYKKAGVDFSLVSGYAEIFFTPEGIGGDLNSTLVAVGLKEADDGEDVIITTRELSSDDASSTDSNKEIPFVERILAFLESTSKELDTINKELGNIAYTDQLTKIYNRWELGRKIDEFLELNRHGKPYGLLFFDIDHFKHINDTYGHDVGDITLRAVVDLIKENLKEGHAFGRWGGEEFVYLVPDVNEISLVSFAESIRKTVEEICFIPVQHLTISIGATMARADDTLESFIKRADEAVYEAKETGRNKVIIH
ncbi:sensor domain-containing diguanylate cyclase [Pseudobutyrivibrio sp.]|uniref:sensor domain-containing diguanylate cyclase n=1 Tax=Pseudobutyrivibrio sp. TaxID=2014367 RepID=UPI001DB3D955|nr:diguanylate cyclase [Pseudobutyrivibrio sp.]MBE5910226.1 diguanylate cyclase [Pseudobutyrivibrio sp.]